MAAEPGRGVGDLGKAGRVALGEAVLPEPADLVEDPLGELAGNALRFHAGHQPLAVALDAPAAVPRRHVAAELVRLARRVVGRHHRQPHHLLLEERHAERLAQHRLQAGVRVDHRLLAVPAPQVGMHHPAGDRAGPHDAHLDHQVVVVARPEPRQHRHLRAALDLEDADRIRAADHVVGVRIVGRYPVERQLPAVVPVDQIEADVELRERAEAQQVDLEQAEILQVVLVPLDHRAAGHRRVLDRHQVVDRLVAEQETARMDGQVPGEVLDLRDQPAQVRVRRRRRIDPGVRQPRRIQSVMVRQAASRRDPPRSRTGRAPCPPRGRRTARGSG